MESLKTITKANVKVFLNVQHSLLREQTQLLNQKFGCKWEIYPIPMDGWTKTEMDKVIWELGGKTVVFASPVPYILKELAGQNPEGTYIFHNDNRTKKESKDGTVRYTIAETGWKLL